MGSLRTVVARLASGLAPIILAAPALAAPDLIPEFAVCAGRLSAVAEHDWLMQRDPARAEAERDGMADLLSAVLDPDISIRAMGWRVDAKAATRALLIRADLQDDAVAGERAAALIAGCRAYLLPGS